MTAAAFAARPFPDRRDIGSRHRLLSRILSEFAAMPCVRLTKAQARRLFGLREDICERVLADLVDNGALRRGEDARYGLKDTARARLRGERTTRPRRPTGHVDRSPRSPRP